MFTHGTPAARDAGPDFGISSFAKGQRYCVPLQSESRKEAVICMGKKNARANQAHKRCNCLDHRNVQSAPARTQRLPPCTVKRIPLENRKWDPTDDLAQQIRQCRAVTRCGRQGPHGGSPMQPLIHHFDALPISAVFGLRYVHDLVRKWAASETHCRRTPSSRHAAGRMVIGAHGDSTVRSDHSGDAGRCGHGGMSRSRQLRLIGEVR
jgi:hypothetical protein